MRQNRIFRICLFTFLLVAISPHPESIASGLEVKGRFRSELYSWSDEKGDHIRPYEYLRADALLWKGAESQKLSIHTYLRWTTDWKDKLSRDPQTFIYETYIKRSKVIRDADIYLGRQFVYTPLGSETIDGFRVHSRIRSDFRLDLFAGSSVSRLAPERIRSFSDYGVLGGRLAYLVDSHTRAGLNWMRRRSEGATSYHRLAIDLRRSVYRWQAYGRLSYDVSEHSISEGLMRASYTPGSWNLSGEYLRRDPSTADNSIFSLIKADATNQLRTELARNIWYGFSLVAQAQLSMYSDENSWRESIGFRTNEYSLMWNHQSGGAGKNDGVSGQISMNLTPQWNCFASTSFSRYRIQSEAKNLIDAYTASVGTLRRFAGGLAVRLEGQYLRNAAQTSAGRLFVSVSKRFSTGSSGQ